MQIKKAKLSLSVYVGIATYTEYIAILAEAVPLVNNVFCLRSNKDLVADAFKNED